LFFGSKNDPMFDGFKIGSALCLLWNEREQDEI